MSDDLDRVLFERVLWIAERVVEDPFSGCWEWQRGRCSAGYGVLRDESGRIRLAHRVVFEDCVGEIGEGLTLDHLCRNPACVRPEHLEPCSIRTNVLRGTSPAAINARKTECLRGHPFTPENTYRNTNGRGCRECRRERQRKRRRAARRSR